MGRFALGWLQIFTILFGASPFFLREEHKEGTCTRSVEGTLGKKQAWDLCFVVLFSSFLVLLKGGRVKTQLFPQVWALSKTSLPCRKLHRNVSERSEGKIELMEVRHLGISATICLEDTGFYPKHTVDKTKSCTT